MFAPRFAVVLLAVAASRCPTDEATDTCDVALAEAQQALEAAQAQCVPGDAQGDVTPREGGFLSTDDGAAVVSVPPGATARAGRIKVDVLQGSPAEREAVSPLVDIRLLDDAGAEVTTFDQPVTVCLKAVGGKPDGSCLGFLDESADPPAWKCEDRCLAGHDDLICGKTVHFTQFAILLDPGAGGERCRAPDPSLVTRRKGGVVSSADDVAFVSVPPGALAADTTITVELASKPENDQPRLTEVYAFGPAGQKFDVPARVCLGGVSPDTKGGCLGYVDESVDPPKWVCEDPCLQQVDDTLCGETDHFTRFAILRDGALPDAACGR